MKRIAMLLLAAGLGAQAKTRPAATNPPQVVVSSAPSQPRAQAKRRGIRSWFRRLATLEPELAVRLSGWGIPEGK